MTQSSYRATLRMQAKARFHREQKTTVAIKETLNTRVTRIEEVMVQLGASQVRMDNALAHLAEVQAQDQTEAREREKRIDERIENLLAEGRNTDARIDKLVIAIGEFISRANGNT